MKDLFGEEEPKTPPKKRPSWMCAYAALPGSGPIGESCRTCSNAYYVRPGHRKYYKCSLVLPTSSINSDIRLKSPACSRWKGEQPPT